MGVPPLILASWYYSKLECFTKLLAATRKSDHRRAFQRYVLKGCGLTMQIYGARFGCEKNSDSPS